MSKTPLFILMGPPGSGKSSIAKKFPESQTVMFGHLIRSLGLGKMDGGLMNTQDANKILYNELKKKKNLFYLILEGYPRTKEQAEFLTSLDCVDVVRVFKLNCSDKECIDRVLNRESCTCGCSYHPRVKPPKKEHKCDSCGEPLFSRSNDTIETLQKRLDLYHQTESDILSVFAGKCKPIDIETDLRAGIVETINMVHETLLRRVSVHNSTIATQNLPENVRVD